MANDAHNCAEAFVRFGEEYSKHKRCKEQRNSL